MKKLVQFKVQLNLLQEEINHNILNTLLKIKDFIIQGQIQELLKCKLPSQILSSLKDISIKKYQKALGHHQHLSYIHHLGN